MCYIVVSQLCNAIHHIKLDHQHTLSNVFTPRKRSQCVKVTTFVPSQLVKGRQEAAAIDVPQKQLEDFYMTNSVSRASPTMARCIAAVKKEASNRHLDK